MAEISHTESLEDPSNRGIIVSAVAVAIGSLAVIGAAVYAAFWLPFSTPKQDVPWSVEILPLTVSPPDVPESIDLDSYGWVDREAGVARIPVEEAMNVIVDTLPVIENASQGARERADAVIPTDAGSGRFVTKPNK